MNSNNKNSIERQRSLKLKKRWINAFQNELLIDENGEDEADERNYPKVEEDLKESELELEYGEDIFDCVKKEALSLESQSCPNLLISCPNLLTSGPIIS